jgi:hypothetical protein
MENPQTALPAEFQSLIERVQEIGKTNHENLVAENRKLIAEAIGQVAGGLKPPVDTSQKPNGSTATPAATTPATTTPTSTPKKLGLLARWVGTQPPRKVSKTEGEMMDEIRTGKVSEETLAVAEAGHQVLGIERAFDRAIVTGPKHGLTGWQIAGIVAGGAVAVSGAVVGGMYLTETGFFAPKPEEG